MKKTFTILGTGWLGYALANKMKDTYNVKVSLKDELKYEDMKQKGFYPFVLNEKYLKNLDELLMCNFLFINYPPSKIDNYLDFLQKIYSHPNIKNIEKIFFISSTSIYPNVENTYDETFEIKKEESKLVVFEAEKIASLSHIIFRCSGLMGYDRIAGRYFSGKSLTSSNKKINHVHRDDVIKATLFSIKNDINGIFNLCSPIHPLRDDLYELNSKKYGFEKPILEYKDKKVLNRVIDGSKIESLGFRYKYQNPMQYL
ncbi:hypothetical protein [Arcobacter sp. YIC-310]|uniref:hypothetical protein n=1 Tax=Arcobacter sp. YIC-310 TaxID=3376632 RepID=UPI003C1C9753